MLSNRTVSTNAMFCIDWKIYNFLIIIVKSEGSDISKKQCNSFLSKKKFRKKAIQSILSTVAVATIGCIWIFLFMHFMYREKKHLFALHVTCIARLNNKRYAHPARNSKKILFIIYLLPTVVRKRIQTVSNNQLKNADSLKFLLSDELFMFMFLVFLFFFLSVYIYVLVVVMLYTFINKFEIIMTWEK